MKSFYHIQLNFVYLLVRIGLVFAEQFAFALSLADFFLLKVFSFWVSVPFNRPPLQPRNANSLFIVYLSQLVAAAGLVVVKILTILMPGFLVKTFTDFTWLGIVFGPFGFFLPWYMGLVCNISTIIHYLPHFPAFNPHYLWYSLLNMSTTGMNIGRYLYDLLKPTGNFFVSSLKNIGNMLKQLLPRGTLFASYKAILIKSGHILKQQGYLGDLIFTPLTLFWIFWPLLIPYYLQEYYLLIPIFPVEIFLIIKGYSTAKLAWSNSN